MKKKSSKSRWMRIVYTSNSGCTQWVCIVCGRVSKTADKRCNRFQVGDGSVECSELVESHGFLPTGEVNAFAGPIHGVMDWSSDVVGGEDDDVQA